MYVHLRTCAPSCVFAIQVAERDFQAENLDSRIGLRAASSLKSTYVGKAGRCFRRALSSMSFSFICSCIVTFAFFVRAAFCTQELLVEGLQAYNQEVQAANDEAELRNKDIEDETQDGRMYVHWLLC